MKKNGERCNYYCQDNFMCKIHADQAVSQDCSICHEMIKHPFDKTTPCGHTFHTNCYNQWHDTPHGDSCPLCRSPVKKMKFDTMHSIIEDVREIHSMFINDFMPAYEVFKLKKTEMIEKIQTLIQKIYSKILTEAPSLTCEGILRNNVDNLLDLQINGVYLLK
jgi:hypothetical protein